MRSLEYVNGLVTAIRDIGTRDWDNVSESHLSSFLNEHLPDFIQVFTLGTRSAQSRQKLEGGAFCLCDSVQFIHPFRQD